MSTNPIETEMDLTYREGSAHQIVLQGLKSDNDVDVGDEHGLVQSFS